MFLIEICEDWTFLYIPWSVQAVKPLRRLKQTELMCCNYAPLLRLLWRYMQALVSATSAGSHRPLFFQDQWACPRRVLGGHRSMSKTSRVFGLTPPLAAPPLFLHRDPHTAKVTGLACMRESAQYSPNINQTLTGKDTAYTERTRYAQWLSLKGGGVGEFDFAPLWAVCVKVIRLKTFPLLHTWYDCKQHEPHMWNCCSFEKWIVGRLFLFQFTSPCTKLFSNIKLILKVDMAGSDFMHKK